MGRTLLNHNLKSKPQARVYTPTLGIGKENQGCEMQGLACHKRYYKLYYNRTGKILSG